MSTATLSYRGVDLLMRLNLDLFIWVATIAAALLLAAYVTG